MDGPWMTGWLDGSRLASILEMALEGTWGRGDQEPGAFLIPSIPYCVLLPNVTMHLCQLGRNFTYSREGAARAVIRSSSLIARSCFVCQKCQRMWYGSDCTILCKVQVLGIHVLVQLHCIG